MPLLFWASIIVFCLVRSSEPLTISIEWVASAHPGSLLRLLAAALSGISALTLLVFSEKISERSATRILRANLGLILVAVLELTWRSLDPDEPLHLHWSWQMGQGLVPYRDFFEIRHFFWHILMSPLLALMDGDLRVILVAKLLTLATTLLALLAACRLTQKLGGWPEAACLAGLATWELMTPGTEFRPDPFAALLTMVSLILVSRNRAGWAGVCGGLAFLFLQKHLMAVGAVGLSLMLASQKEPGYGIRPALRYSMVAAVVGSLCIIWAATVGVFSDYIRCAWVYASAFVTTFQKTSVWKSNFDFIMLRELASNPWPFVAGAIGLFLLLKRPGSPLGGAPEGPGLGRLVALTAVWCWLGAFAIGMGGYLRYLMVPQLLLTILAGVGAMRLRSEGSPLRRSLPSVALCMCAYLCLIRWAADPPTPMDFTDASVALVNTARGESYYGEDNMGNFAHPIFRHDAGYYGSSQTFFGNMFLRLGFDPPQGNPADLKLLVAHPPKAMVLPNSQREQLAIQVLKAAGFQYRKQGRVYLRD